MTQKNIISQAELIKQTLDTHRHRELDIFRPHADKPDFWKLPELAILYPNIFDTKKPISQKTIQTIDTMVTDAIPKFSQLIEKPVHILTVKETYNIYDPETNRIRTVKNGKSQNLTRIACEYLFGQHDGTELEQAYFLHQNQTAQELTEVAQDLKFEKIRNRIAQTSNLLSAVINRAYGADKSSFRKIWSLVWQTLYKTDSIETLREQYNVKTSPIDYMKPQTLIFINAMLQEIVFNFANKPYYTLADIRHHIITKANLARAKFIQYGSTPEEQLVKKNSYYTIEKIRRMRKNMWHSVYPQSLQER